MSAEDDDIMPERTRAMADMPPPPLPFSPLKLILPTPPPTSRAGETRNNGGDNESAPTSSTSSLASSSLSPATEKVVGNNEPPPPPPTTPSTPLLSPPLLLEIEEGTPAAEALKANADVRVSKLRKVGRSTKLQAGVRAFKSGRHTGDRRGAPPFVAPRGREEKSLASASGMPPPTIPEVEDEEGDSDDRRDGDGLSGSEEDESSAGGRSAVDDDDSSSLDHSLDRSMDLLDDTRNDRSLFSGATPGSPQRKSFKFVAHPALPAVVAAACFAGEESDRRRCALEAPAEATAGPTAHKSPMKSPFTSLFKLSAPALSSTVEGDAENALQTRRREGGHRRSNSITEGMGMHRRATSAVLIPEDKRLLLPQRRASSFCSAGRNSFIDDIHHMPSEISVDETVKHGNIRLDDEQDSDHSSISVDGDIHATADAHDDDATKLQTQKGMGIGPIIVNIPGSRRRLSHEEAKEEDGIDEEDADHQKARKAKSRKKLIKNSDDAFAFLGPSSVRKWVKRRRSQEETKDPRSYVKGKVIDGKHELYTMSIAVMFGMRTSIGRTNQTMSETAHNLRRWMDNDDLMAVVKYEFPPRGSDITPPHLLNHTFKFKDYSPLAFAYLRRMFGVNEYDFLLSVCGNANYIEFQSNAKSGQFFFYSPDGKYMIKTMTNTESKFLRRITPHYFHHCAMNPNTLITKFLGMYRVKLYHLKRNVKFVVMKSVYDTDKHLHQLFDVKGSITGRDAKPGDAVKKDNDIRRTLPDGAFILEPDLRERLKTQVQLDCEWLSSMKIMDYSMLVGVHNISHRSTKTPLKPVVQRARPLSNDDGDDCSSSSFDASNASCLDHFLEVDDDDSYLDGAHCHKGSKSRVDYDASTVTSGEAVRTVRVVKSPSVDNESSRVSRKEMDKLVEKAIEDMYWPFHRFYDIQGLRRMKAPHGAPEAIPGNEPKQSDKQEDDRMNILNAVHSPKLEVATASGGRCDLPAFERPLSYRKDGGFMMDTTTCDLPLRMSVPGAPHMVEYCDGKIFYMGIIDILQQFNIRKRGEARYRRLGGKGWEAASCVHPNIYADRFIRFFEEYTACSQLSSAPNDTLSESVSNRSVGSSRGKTKTE